MAKIADKKPILFQVEPVLEVAMKEEVFFVEAPEDEESCLLDDEMEMQPIRKKESSMEYHSRLNGWKQSDYV